ncbi:MAG TPA: hypothetical protein VF841_05470, partial [Anaeromyxobacter sp.]
MTPVALVVASLLVAQAQADSAAAADAARAAAAAEKAAQAAQVAAEAAAKAAEADHEGEDVIIADDLAEIVDLDDEIPATTASESDPLERPS